MGVGSDACGGVGFYGERDEKHAGVSSGLVADGKGLALSRIPTSRVLIAALAAVLSVLLAVGALAADPKTGKAYSAFTARTRAATIARIAAISGTLSKPGYTVIALAANGKATSTRATHGSFSLRPPAGRVTLQLRAPSGIYAGPVVIGSEQHGARAIVGVRAGARLGKVTVNIRRGYASVARRVARRWVDTSRWARARKGIPIGAGDFGRVRSKPPRVSPPGDLDADGVPDRLDIDINGNLILNKVDRSTRSRARMAQAESPFYIGTSLFGGWYGSALNADARAVSDADIDQSLATSKPGEGEFVAIGLLPGSPELDCGGAPDPRNPQGWIGGLSYCTRGGTGVEVLTVPTYPTLEAFPACCDPDGNGYGTLTNNSHMPYPGSFSLKPNATASQIRTGDVLIQRVMSNGVRTDTPTMLPFVFATVSELVAYDDGQGDKATITYPVDPNTGPGTHGNGFPLAAGPNGDVAVKLTFWRPQRRSIPPEPGAWTDIGKLSYWASIQSGNASGECPKSAYTLNDPNLSPSQEHPNTHAGGVTDLAADQPADPAHTFTYTLNITNCLAAFGAKWNPGDEAYIHFWAADGFTSSSSQTDMWTVFTRR